MKIDPKAGDIWKDSDPRQVRFVKVRRVGETSAYVQRVEWNEHAQLWVVPRNAPTREVRLASFDTGKRTGYKFHQSAQA